jgi:3-deoxy-manno-octulosonate cytidylyltransferase (CMP-KDO synthetase)
MSALIVIPARYGSSRFPGKPLHQIAGLTLLQRVWRIARASSTSAEVLIATDDERISMHAKSFGATVVMTDTDCRNGSERTHQALQRSGLNPKIVINLQGDTPLTPPEVLNSLISAMEGNPEIEIGTPGVRLTLADHSAAVQRIGANVGGTYVATTSSGKALYFSRFPIPFIRNDVKDKAPKPLPFFKHIGIYAFRPDVLARFIALPPSPLEQLEQLEQLRALENDISINVVEVDLRGRKLASVDTPDDALEVERILAAQGDVV